jgi:hypothetical protein|tara:strand:- start:59 stop:256 length:198 start_codon:yes stop_codon:yes gene_type:complete
MIKKEWSWMLNLPKKDDKVGLKSYMCNINKDKETYDDDEQYLEDGVDDFIGRPKKDTYNDDDYDY